MEYEIEVTDDSTATRIGLLVRCPKCGKMVTSTGLPVRLSYISDTKKKCWVYGLMCLRPEPKHDFVCPGSEATL